MTIDRMDKELLQTLRSSGKVSDAVLASLAERIDRLTVDLDKNSIDTGLIRRKLEQIEHAIVGNEAMGQWGLAKLHGDTRTRLHRLEKMTAIGSGIILTASLFWNEVKAKLFGN